MLISIIIMPIPRLSNQLFTAMKSKELGWGGEEGKLSKTIPTTFGLEGRILLLPLYIPTLCLTEESMKWLFVST
jgi:hypothetical protein